MLQIYFDFSGYSDMAIGLGRMFGFHFSENFDYPSYQNPLQNFEKMAYFWEHGFVIMFIFLWEEIGFLRGNGSEMY